MIEGHRCGVESDRVEVKFREIREDCRWILEAPVARLLSVGAVVVRGDACWSSSRAVGSITRGGENMTNARTVWALIRLAAEPAA